MRTKSLEWKAVMCKSGPHVERGVTPCPNRVNALFAASGRSPSGVFVVPSRDSHHIVLTILPSLLIYFFLTSFLALLSLIYLVSVLDLAAGPFSPSGPAGGYCILAEVAAAASQPTSFSTYG